MGISRHLVIPVLSSHADGRPKNHYRFVRCPPGRYTSHSSAATANRPREEPSALLFVSPAGGCATARASVCDAGAMPRRRPLEPSGRLVPYSYWKSGSRTTMRKDASSSGHCVATAAVAAAEAAAVTALSACRTSTNRRVPYSCPEAAASSCRRHGTGPAPDAAATVADATADAHDGDESASA